MLGWATLFHGITEFEGDRLERMLTRRFDESDEINSDSGLTGVYCTTSPYPWASIPERRFIGRVLVLDMACFEDADTSQRLPGLVGWSTTLVPYAERTRAGLPTGDYWVPAAFLCMWTRWVREIDPGLKGFLSDVAGFWHSCADYWRQREALEGL